MALKALETVEKGGENLVLRLLVRKATLVAFNKADDFVNA